MSGDSMLPNLALAGFMGTGKSTLSTLVAGQLGWSCIDTDTLIEQGAGMAMRNIFRDARGDPPSAPWSGGHAKRFPCVARW